MNLSPFSFFSTQLKTPLSCKETSNVSERLEISRKAELEHYNKI